MARVRSDHDLIAQMAHLTWDIRQVLELGARLDEIRRSGTEVLHDPIDAAVLEAFLIHARALTEFFWTQHTLRRDGTPVHPNDARAADWFIDELRVWAPGPMPAVLEDLVPRVGYGLAHVSFRRLSDGETWGWKPLEIAHHLVSRFYEFAATAPTSRLPEGFQSDAYDIVMKYREAVRERHPFEAMREPPQPVGTPGFAVSTPAR